MTLAAEETGVLGLRRGADQEVDRLFRRFGGDVRRQVRVLVRDRSDVEDLVQQTFLKALAALHRGQRPRSPRPWLLAIARNECRMHYRSESRRPALVALDEARGAAAPRDGARAGELREALLQLHPAQREALVLREFEGRGYAEIAESLGLSVPAVETLLFRARRALREQLESVGGCAEASALLAAEALTDAQRRFLRAHVRTCAGCATLERRRRGKLAALKRIGGVLPLPQWLSPLFGAGGVKAVVAVTLAAVAAGGGAEVVRSDASPRPAPAPLVHRDAVPHALAPVQRAPAPVRGSAPARPAARPQAPAARPPAPAPAAPRAQAAPAPVPPVAPAVEHPRAPRPAAKPQVRAPADAATPAQTTAGAPQPPPLTTSTVPASVAATPPLTVPSATTPVAATPRATVPSAAVPTTPAATVPSVTVGSATTPVATTPSVTTPALTVP